MITFFIESGQVIIPFTLNFKYGFHVPLSVIITVLACLLEPGYPLFQVPYLQYHFPHQGF